MTALAPVTAPSRTSVLCFLVGSMLLMSCALHYAVASSVREMEGQFVYGLTVWDALTYTSGLSPQPIDEIHIIADSDNILAPYDTRAYFWPITGEYVADWS